MRKIISTALNTVKIDPIDVLICQVMKITKVKDKIIACPAIILAKRRIISAKGFVKMPKTSINGITGGIFSHSGTLGHRISFQYFFVPEEVYCQHSSDCEQQCYVDVARDIGASGKNGDESK